MFGRFGKVLQGAALAALCVYVIRLYVQDTINLYIHPRYSIFALVMAVLGLLLLTAWFITALRKRAFAASGRPSFVTIVVDVLVVVLLVFAFVLPAQPLSSQVVQRKTLTAPGVSDTANRRTQTSQDCMPDTPKTLQDWVMRLDMYPNPDCYKDMPVSVTGFVYVSSDQPLPEGYLYVSRLVMSCCVVDARPFALPVQTDQVFVADSWLQVEGKIAEQTINGTKRLVIVPTAITPTSRPQDVYGY